MTPEETVADSSVTDAISNYAELPEDYSKLMDCDAEDLAFLQRPLDNNTRPLEKPLSISKQHNPLTTYFSPPTIQDVVVERWHQQEKLALHDRQGDILKDLGFK